MSGSGAGAPGITGAARLVGFIGDPVAQAKSPQTFNAILAARGRDAIVAPMHLRSEDFDAAIGGVMAIANLDGLVVTMPFKQRIMAHLDEVSARARAVGAVNAARRTDEGRWIGDMFDGVGLLGVMEGLGLEPAGLRVGLLGAGGAGSAIGFALAEAGVGALTIADPDESRAQTLAARIARQGATVSTCGAIDIGSIDLLINATPIGMAPDDDAPIDVTGLRANVAVIDIVTRPGTRLLEAAAQRGCRHEGGAAMVTAQARAILSFIGL